MTYEKRTLIAIGRENTARAVTRARGRGCSPRRNCGA